VGGRTAVPAEPAHGPDRARSRRPAVCQCSPPLPVWVNLAALTQHRKRGKPHSETPPGGLSVAGLVRGIMWV
jgi:hypothetical protein